MFLRTLETRVNSVVGLSGSLFAARRDVCRQWAPDRQSDFSTLLSSVRLGLRGVLDSESAGYYRNITDDRRELQRKIRTVVRGIAVLMANAGMLMPLRNPVFAWQLASHKLCRWLVPFGMLGAAVANLFLLDRSVVYQITFAAQFAFYASAFAGLRTRARILRLPSYLLLANFAILVAWLCYARGDRMTTWNPSERLRALPQISTH
jgi:hypothetical protein